MLSTEPTKHYSSRSMHSSSYSKKPKKKRSHPHIEYLQEQIDTLKAELNEIETIESKHDALTQEEEELLGQKSTKEAHLEQTMTIFNKLSESAMASRSQSYYETERKKKGDEQILSILQFFYIVRLGQQGLFSIIAQVAPLVDIDSLTNICDQLVGTSLYAAKDPNLSNRARHKTKLFDILHKLENGVDEPVYDGANTTFKQAKDLVDHILENTKDEKSVMQHYSKLPKQEEDASPTWIVMPYQSMMTDLSSQMHSKDQRVVKQDDEVLNGEPKQEQEASAKSQQGQDVSSSSSSSLKAASADAKDIGDHASSSSLVQEETKQLSDSEAPDAEKQALNASIQYSSESDNWRQRQPRGRGRGGRGHGRGGSGRGFTRGRGSRSQGKRPRGAYGSKTEDQPNTTHYSDVQHTTESTA